MSTNVKTINFQEFNTDIVEIETKILRGMNKFNISGFNSNRLNFSKERIILSIKSAGIRIPNGKISTNFIPSSTKTKTNHFDLPIAISIISKIYELYNLENYLICGELGINGDLIEIFNPSRIINCAIKNNIQNIIIPFGNYDFPKSILNVNIFPAKNLSEVISHLRNFKKITHSLPKSIKNLENSFDINDLISLQSVIRALIISITGKHNILIKGPIGTGKSLSIKSINSVFNQLQIRQKLILSDIYTRYFEKNISITSPQIVYPNLKVTSKKLFGTNNKIGEVALANYGFLCFDEINLFSKNILDQLKIMMDNDQVYQSNKIKIYEFPIDYAVIATMNPCPCGNYGTKNKCICTLSEITRFNKKLDLSFLDRFAIKITIQEFEFHSNNNYNIKEIKSNINKALLLQKNRYNSVNIKNGNINSKKIKKYISINRDITILLDNIISKYKLSKRSIDNIIKVSRTIADLNNRLDIVESDVLEALRYQI